MKKIYYLLCLFAVVLMTACTHEEEDLFNDSSANRADATVKAYLEILADAANGWVMEYFPESHQVYGGYNVIVSFGKDGKVKAAGELAAPSRVETSLYSLKQSAGIMLSFDTYNEIFHFFSDPSDPSGVGGNGNGLEGDFDFLILEATADKVVLKGKKTGGIAVLTPAKGEWSTYLASVQELDAAMSAKKYELQIDGMKIPAAASNHTLTFTYEEDGNSRSQVAPYIVTLTGYKFYAPIVINGITLEGFTYDAASDTFTATGQSDVKMVKVIPPLNEQFLSGNWYIAYSDLGSFGKLYFDVTKTALDAEGEVLFWAYMGSKQYGAFGFTFNSSGYLGLLEYDSELIGEDKIALKFGMRGQGNGIYYHNNLDFHYMLNVFGYSAARTFTLTTDNIGDPTYIILSEDGNPNNVIKLHASPINYPFDN